VALKPGDGSGLSLVWGEILRHQEQSSRPKRLPTRALLTQREGHLRDQAGRFINLVLFLDQLGFDGSELAQEVLRRLQGERSRARRAQNRKVKGVQARLEEE